jgi:hypothetical protein
MGAEMTEQQKDEHKDGPPWDSARVFSSFEEASVFRATCQQKKQLQVKIKKYLNNVGENVFVVKTRPDPKLAHEPVREKKKDKSSK